MDTDHKLLLEEPLKDFRTLLRKYDMQTKSDVGDDYYLLFDFFNLYTGLFLSTPWMTQPGIRESLLKAGMKVLFVEAYDIQEMASVGNYFVSMRELRYLLEFGKRAALLDHQLTSSSLRDKLSEYQRRENANQQDFRGKGLRLLLTTAFSLSAVEATRFDTLFNYLSSHAHGSYEEISVADRGARPARYDRSKFSRVLQYAGAVSDVYLFLMGKMNFVNRDFLVLPTDYKGYFPLSWSHLGATP